MWSDRETDRDCLGYTSYVAVLHDVCIHKDIAPLTLGIFGSWGSGKTSLMKMLKGSIDKAAAESFRRDQNSLQIKTLWFNAWKYEGREEAQSALIHAIMGRLESDQTIGAALKSQCKDVFDKLKRGAGILKLGKCIAQSAITLTPDAEGFGKFVESLTDESEKISDTMESFDEDFNKLLTGVKVERMVVFIDDLDRCSAAKVIETFETIKLFLNTPQCTFVIGADPDKIKAAVGEVYRATDARVQKDYLEKIVQIPFSIPEQSLKDITCYIGMLILGSRLEEEGWKQVSTARGSFYDTEEPLTKFSEWATQKRELFNFDGGGLDELLEELRFVIPYVGAIARGLAGNPRQIKRFLNILALRRRLAHANSLNVDPALIIKMGVLEYVWEDFFQSTVQTLDPETGKSELLKQVVAASAGSVGEQDSPLVRDVLGRPALLGYLTADPQLTGDIDLRPYLFLAQTALHRPAAPALQPIEEEAQRLANAIASADPVVSGAGWKQAAARELAVAAAVVPLLGAKLPESKEAKQQAHMILGLDAIARRHPSLFQPSIDALITLGSSDNDAVALAAQALMKNARTAGVTLPVDLENRFRPKSRIIEAFTGPKKGKH